MLISVSDEVIYKWMQWRLCKCTIAFLAFLSILSMQVKMFSKYWGNLKINPCILYLFSPICTKRWTNAAIEDTVRQLLLSHTYPKPRLGNVVTQISGPRWLQRPDLCAWDGFALLRRGPINSRENWGAAFRDGGSISEKTIDQSNRYLKLNF